MASQLRVDEIIASTGSSVAIGTAGGSVTLAGDFTVDTSKGLNVGTGATIFSPSSNVLTLGTNSAERVRIDSSGHFIMPAGNFDLMVGDSTNSNAGTQTISVGSTASGSSGGIQLWANPTNGNSWVQFGDDSASASQYRGWVNYQHTNDNLNFGTAGTERLRITSSGRISINNTSGPTDIPGTAHDTVVVGNPTATGGGITLEVASGSNCSFNMYAQGSQPAARFLYDGSINGARIYTQNSGGTTESIRMTFQENGNVSIANGNLVFSTSGTGIDFSATANGGTTTPSELLDDYEEGTWTPSIKFGGNSVGMTYTRQEGHYTKIGRQVFAQFRITLSSKGTSTGQLRIEGLPFTAADVFTSTGIDGQVHIGHDDGFNATNASNNPISGYVEGGTNYLLLTARDSNAALSTMSNSYVDNDLSISASVTFYA